MITHDEKKFFFMAGLPRSGGTLLSSILSQNPDVYVSPQSTLLTEREREKTGFLK
jgi:hypothetical protein